MADPDVLALLEQLEIRGRVAVQTYLGAEKTRMEEMGLSWTRDQVLAHLREVLAEESTSGEMGEPSDEQVGEQWIVTPAGDNDPASDLATIATGAPGN